MLRITNFKLIIPVVLVLVFGLLAGFVLYQKNIPSDPALPILAGLDDTDYPSYQFDFIRDLVNAHSLYQKELVSADITPNPVSISGQFFLYVQGGDETPPTLSSAARAQIFARLLNAAGFKARLVTLFAPDEALSSFTMVEAYNPRTRRWELQDQDRNVFYKFRTGNQRVDVREMIGQPLDNVLPCPMEGYCSWETVSPEGLSTDALKAYFGVALIRGKWKNTLIVNPARFDLEHSGLCRRYPGACAGKTVFYD